MPPLGKGFHIADYNIIGLQRNILYACQEKFSIGKGIVDILLGEMIEEVVKEGV